MAAPELRGELKYRDGDSREFVVKTEKSLQSVLSGIRTLSADVSEALTELVSQDGGTAGNGVDQLNADEEEDQSKTRQKGTSRGPPAKRTKTLKA
uniref:Si:dkeyp-55f12.3 n=1 Tax=Paramormyrops kingsleyae TaxID=1676925 RepID=A0A3B3SMC8_9TELE